MAEKWILIVDDEGSILTVLKNSLKKLGDEYHVITASNGYEALEQIGKCNFDLVITDYKMDGMDGLQLLDRIHTLRPKTRVILMTAYGNAGVEAESERLKAYRYLAKPFDIETFRSIVRGAFGSPSGARQGLLVLSDDEYLEVNQTLQQLKTALGARAVLLTDCEGKYIACSGIVNDLPLDKIATLLVGSLATLVEAGSSIDNDPDAISLAYREGENDNLFVVNVGIEFMLIILIQHGSINSRLGTVWYVAQSTVTSLKTKFTGLKHTLPGNVLNPNMAKAVSSELQKILSDPKKTQLAKEQDAPALHQVEKPRESEPPQGLSEPKWPSPPTLLTFDEAQAKGIMPGDFGQVPSSTSSVKDAPNDKH